MDIDAALGEEGNTPLRFTGFVLGQVLKFVVCILEVAYVTVASIALALKCKAHLRPTLSRLGKDTASHRPRKACRLQI